jgi:hypothetical protein
MFPPFEVINLSSIIHTHILLFSPPLSRCALWPTEHQGNTIEGYYNVRRWDLLRRRDKKLKIQNEPSLAYPDVCGERIIFLTAAENYGLHFWHNFMEIMHRS